MRFVKDVINMPPEILKSIKPNKSAPVCLFLENRPITINNAITRTLENAIAVGSHSSMLTGTYLACQAGKFPDITPIQSFARNIRAAINNDSTKGIDFFSGLLIP
jgi:hypothetical protein